MISYKLAFLGFGNVGQALARLLLRKMETLQNRYGLTFTVTAIATSRRGNVVHSQGVDLSQVLHAVDSGGNLAQFPTRPISDTVEWLHACDADVLFESIPVNYETGQPAVNYLEMALRRGMHAISANKGPVVHAYRHLTELAQAHGVEYRFESAVMDGAPIFSLAREALPAVDVHRLRGILNSTTNLILERMQAGETLEEAVAYAQSIGIAETDPRGDLDGWDAAVKVAALCTVVLGAPLKPQQVERQGILGITPADIARARQSGQRWKLVCEAYWENGVLRARVAPSLVGPESPLFGVQGTSSMLTLETDVLPGLTIIEGNPGTETTAYGMLADFLNAVKMHPKR